jgi:hypothetical protein
MEAKNKLELWEDGKEASEDSYNEEQPSKRLLYLTNNTSFGESESI